MYRYRYSYRSRERIAETLSAIAERITLRCKLIQTGTEPYGSGRPKLSVRRTSGDQAASRGGSSSRTARVHQMPFAAVAQ